MNKIPHEKEMKARIEELSLRIISRLNIDWLTITNYFQFEQGNTTIATTAGEWEYRNFTITWNLAVATTLTDKELQLTVIHEIIHTLIEPMWDMMGEELQTQNRKINEMVVENLARAFYSALY